METETRLPTQSELNQIWRSLDPDLPDFSFEWSACRTFTAATVWYTKRLVVLSVKHYLEFGMDEVVKALKHEAAHYLAWSLRKDRGHGQWFWYYLGKLGGARHCPTLSADMKAKRIRIIGPRRTYGIEYDPVTKQFRQIK